MLLLATPLAAQAGAPAQDQYSPPPLNATGSGHGPGSPGGTGSQPGAAQASGGGSDSPAMPILIGGLGVLGAAALIIYLRRRNAARQRA